MTKSKIISDVKSYSVFFLSFTVFAFLLIKNTEMREAVITSFNMCMTKILPTLFPAMIVSSFIAQTGFPGIFDKIFSFISIKLFGISGGYSGALITGFTAGYPAGVKTAFQKYKSGLSDIKSAARTAIISVNPGIAFTVLTVGKQMYNSAKTGVFLYFSVLAAQISAGLIIRLTKGCVKSESGTKPVVKKSYSESIINAVESSSGVCISVCAWICAFAFVLIFVKYMPLQNLNCVFPYIFEISSAVSYSLYNGSVILTAFSLGFGGLSVFAQLLPDIKSLKIRSVQFLVMRFIIGILSAGYMKLFCIIFPEYILTYGIAAPTVMLMSNDSLYGLISLLFLCLIFMFGIAKKYNVC